MQFHPKDLSELDELTEEHLGFSALSDGLGFAKQTKPKNEVKKLESRPANKAMGSGAVSAGLAMPSPGIFLPPKTTSTISSAPAVATQVATNSSKASSTSASNTLTMPAASPAIRSASFLLDLGIVFFPLLATWMFSFGSESLEIFLHNPQTPLTLFAIVFIVYFLLSESFGGQSLGKMALGLRVVEDDKYEKPIRLNHTVFRLVAFIFGTALCGAGLWMCFRDSKLRPWHDRFTGTIVRKKP